MAVFKENKKESEWVEYYKSLLDNNSSDLTRAEPTLGTAQTPSPLDFPFNCSEIKKGIKRLKNSKKRRYWLNIKRIHKNRKLYLNFNFSKAI